MFHEDSKWLLVTKRSSRWNHLVVSSNAQPVISPCAQYFNFAFPPSYYNLLATYPVPLPKRTETVASWLIRRRCQIRYLLDPCSNSVSANYTGGSLNFSGLYKTAFRISARPRLAHALPSRFHMGTCREEVSVCIYVETKVKKKG